jgi:hypothetical protein
VIDFRYHVISIVAVFLALATGLVLGASLLNTQLIETQNAQNESLIDDKNALRGEVDALEQEQDSLVQFIGAAGQLAVRDLLVDQRVVIVTLPGAAEGTGQEMLDGIGQDLLDAGAIEVVGTVAITEQWTDAGEVDVLDGLVAQLTQEGVELPEGTAYDRAAVLLAHALVGPRDRPGGDSDPTTTTTTTSPTTTPPTEPSEPTEGLSQDEVATILEGLSAGGFVSYDTAPFAAADLAVVVAPPAPDAIDERTETVNAAWVRLAMALDEIGTASVVAGTASAAESGGMITALRADEQTSAEVSTVDSADARPGQIATVVALAAELNGQTGHYGQVGDVDGPIAVILGPEAG